MRATGKRSVRKVEKYDPMESEKKAKPNETPSPPIILPLAPTKVAVKVVPKVKTCLCCLIFTIFIIPSTG
jgi:hypothetical protein